MNIQDRVIKINHVYVDPSLRLFAPTMSLPEIPKEISTCRVECGSWLCACQLYLDEVRQYNESIKECKASSVLFDPWKPVRALLGDKPILTDTFYPLQCEVEISEVFSHCTEGEKHYRKVARLIPEAKEEKHKCQECGKEINKGEYKTFGVCDDCWDKHYEKLRHNEEAPIVEESQTVKIEVNKNAIPRKAKLVEAYETDHQIIIMFGKEEIPESHSCDDMGCGSFSHVKYILTKP